MSTGWMILLTGLTVAGCSGSPVSPSPTGGESVNRSSASDESSGDKTSKVVELVFDHAATHERLALEWLDVEDSRCPTGVNCVWQGQVTVALEARSEDQEPVRLELTLTPGREPETASVFGYELELLSVDPHPKYGVTPERSAYVAEIEIFEA